MNPEPLWSPETDEPPAAPSPPSSSRSRVLRLLPLVIATLVLLAGAVGTSRGWKPQSFFLAPTPNMTATAVAVDPYLLRTMRTAGDSLRRSLECACDRSLSGAYAGPALLANRAAVRDLRSRGEYLAVLATPVVPGRMVVRSARSADADATQRSTQYVYRHGVPRSRASITMRVRYHLTRTRAGWRIDRARLLSLSRHAVTIPPLPALSAAAVYLYDDRARRGIYAYHANDERLVASTAKMMTALVAARALPLDRVVTVPSDAMSVGTAVGGTVAGLYTGERMRVRDLFYGMLLPSGNDAAETLADVTAGSAPAFAAMMNARAAELRLTHSHFVVPHGLDVNGQYSSARDLAVIAHAIIHHRFLSAVVRTREYRTTSADGGTRYDWTNLNKLLWSYHGAIGVKTGTTPLAGANLVAAAQRGHGRLIAVLLGDTKSARFTDAKRLLDWGWDVVVSR